MKPKMLIHMMGICGTAMGSLAGLLKEMGHQVRGSDQNIYPPMSLELERMKIPVALGFDPKNLEPRPDLVIVGNVMSRQNTEVQALLASDIPYMSLPQAMGQFLIADRHSIVVAGTHGKTTTTAAASLLLTHAGFDPGYMIGGIPLSLPHSFAVGQGPWFVIEGDEYDTAFFDKVPKFIHYRPRSVILTSIEFDHADIYNDLEAVKNAFTRLFDLVPTDGLLIYRGEDVNIQSLLSRTKAKNVISYGLQNCDWTLGPIHWGETRSEFDVLYRGKKQDRLESPLFGDYNLLNLLSVYVLGRELGISHEKVKQALALYKGVKRRQEILGVSPHGVTVIDDFAHHPTAVKVTLQGVRNRFQHSRVIAVFEPRSATSRRNVFQKDFASALSFSDHIVLSVPYDQSKIPENERLNVEKLAGECTASVFVARSVEDILGHLKKYVRKQDVVVLMSNGGFGGIYSEIVKSL